MKRVCLIDLPGLSRDLLQAVPPASRLGQWLAKQRIADLQPSFPAVTCSVQATLTTGAWPAEHGIIANGLATYRSADDQKLVDLANHADYRCEVSFWEQSNQLLQRRRFWQNENGTSRYKTAMLFFQNAMPGFAGQPQPAADIIITPKPEHGPDGKTISLVWTNPRELEAQLTAELGPFPLMHYWGPMAGIQSSQWIVRAATAVWKQHQPQLQLVYVPHLDYDLQRFGPTSDKAKQAVADVAAALEPLLEQLEQDQAAVVLIGEYAMEEVNRSIAPNRLFAEAGLLQTRQTDEGPRIDYARSRAFAMCDHQIAHIYTQDASAADTARQILAREGCEILERSQLSRVHLHHRRSGDLVASAPAGGWFDYRWWSDPADAPAFARTVDIHRKPGYDPLELFFDPAARAIIQDPARIRGSHGRQLPTPAVLAGDPAIVERQAYQAIDVPGVIERAMAL